jgi:hypothetical protein
MACIPLLVLPIIESWKHMGDWDGTSVYRLKMMMMLVRRRISIPTMKTRIDWFIWDTGVTVELCDGPIMKV